jgi:hypothetical protein
VALKLEVHAARTDVLLLLVLLSTFLIGLLQNVPSF